MQSVQLHFTILTNLQHVLSSSQVKVWQFQLCSKNFENKKRGGGLLIFRERVNTCSKKQLWELAKHRQVIVRKILLRNEIRHYKLARRTEPETCYLPHQSGTIQAPACPNPSRWHHSTLLMHRGTAYKTKDGSISG